MTKNKTSEGLLQTRMNQMRRDWTQEERTSVSLLSKRERRWFAWFKMRHQKLAVATICEIAYASRNGKRGGPLPGEDRKCSSYC